MGQKQGLGHGNLLYMPYSSSLQHQRGSPRSIDDECQMDPMERCLFFTTSPPRLHCHAGGARPTFTEGGQLRWDLLSQGRGLFLKQTIP